MAAAVEGSTGASQHAENVTYVSLSELRELCSKALSTLGYTEQEISVLSEVGTFQAVHNISLRFSSTLGTPLNVPVHESVEGAICRVQS